jgi:hypothetical protein
MAKYTARFRAGEAVVEVQTENPDRVIKHAFNSDIKLGAFPRWVPFQGQEVTVEVIDNERSGVYMFVGDKHIKQ